MGENRRPKHLPIHLIIKKVQTQAKRQFALKKNVPTGKENRRKGQQQTHRNLIQKKMEAKKRLRIVHQ